MPRTYRDGARHGPFPHRTRLVQFETTFVSARVDDYQSNQLLGPLLSQLWVRWARSSSWFGLTLDPSKGIPAHRPRPTRRNPRTWEFEGFSVLRQDIGARGGI